MLFEGHCRRCNDILGAPFPEVHHWLDALAWVPPHGRASRKNADWPHCGPLNPNHRKYRHNMVGVEQVRKMWGDQAASAAALHVLDDIYGPVPHSVNHVIPLDEADYVRKGCY